VFICFIIIFFAHQHKAAGVKTKQKQRVIIIIGCFFACLLFVYYLSATTYYGE